MNADTPEQQHISRRDFFWQSAGLIGAMSMAMAACNVNTIRASQDIVTSGPGGFQLPALGYAYNALEPIIDAHTMQIHHSQHHADHIAALNQALQNHPFYHLPIEDILLRLNELPDPMHMIVRNHGSGHANHCMLWEIMQPGGSTQPAGVMSEAIIKAFGTFESFQARFEEAGSQIFGSGWVWLLFIEDKLHIITTANQDSPLINGQFPIMGNEIWEHAHYLKYQNRRADYLRNWWKVVNWDEVARRYDRARKTG